jgi:hypothetical protein
VTRRTETLFRAFGDDAMNQLGPENVSALVTFLASPEAGHINGQAFVVYGGLIQLVKGWHEVAKIENQGGWQVSDVATRLPELFRTESSKLEPLG